MCWRPSRRSYEALLRTAPFSEDFDAEEGLRRVKAEREGFEPPVPVTGHLISNQAHSTTLTPLRKEAKLKIRMRVAGLVNLLNAVIAQ